MAQIKAKHDSRKDRQSDPYVGLCAAGATIIEDKSFGKDSISKLVYFQFIWSKTLNT